MPAWYHCAEKDGSALDYMRNAMAAGDPIEFKPGLAQGRALFGVGKVSRVTTLGVDRRSANRAQRSGLWLVV